MYKHARTHTLARAHTLAYRDLLSGNKKRFCLATDTIKVLSSSGWMSGSLSWASTKHFTPPADLALEMDGRVCLSEWRSFRGRGGGREVVERWGESVQSHPREAPRQQQLSPFWQHKTKRAPSVPPASGPPSLPLCTSPPSAPLNPSPPLTSSPCPVLFVLPGRITWSRGQTWGPKHPGLTAFTCDPHS